MWRKRKKTEKEIPGGSSHNDLVIWALLVGLTGSVM